MSKLDAKRPLYKMLVDAELRRKTYGQKIMVIDDVAIDGGGELDHTSWENVHFKEVDFYGRFNQDELKNVTFEQCRFLGCGFFTQKMEDVTFTKCATHGQAYIMSHEGIHLVFEDCDFTDQKDAEPNHWGGVWANEGEVLFKRCKAKHINVSGKDIVRYEDCDFVDMDIACGQGITGEEMYAHVEIVNCRLNGKIDMLGSTLASLTLTDTTLGGTFLTPDTIRDVVGLENVKGHYFWLHANKMPMKGVSLKNCEFSVKDDNYGALNVWQKGNPLQLEVLLIENIKCGIGGDDRSGGMYQTGEVTVIKNIEAPKFAFMFQGKKTTIEGMKVQRALFENVYKTAPNAGQAPNVLLKDCAISNVADFKGVKLPSLTLENVRINKLDLSDTHFKQLVLRNSTTETLIDLTNAIIESGDLSGMVGGQKIKVITTGSNVTVKDGKLTLLPVKKK